MEPVKGGQWHFEGELGARIDGNVENWLLRVWDANPGLIEMFRRRDRHLPYDEPVPWAGEFAGKYLISAVQACRMSDDPRLKPFVQQFVDDLVATQADDGYLGPWPKNQRLLGHWDLWGHYHCMLGLLMWYDDTGDVKAYQCAVRAADCICYIYAEGARRPLDAGTPMINLSVLHVFGQLYRRTANPRYLEMMNRIEQDMQQDGDWLRKGAEGVPYYMLPGGGTRWESQHIVQGIVEGYRITGEERYKKAAVSLWDSIREYDRHPSGAFSTNECAFGSVYAAGPIETCCSVAWLALTIDVLRLTGDPTVADELELTTWNQVLGAQHPSGNWCTYDNPINGVRAPSYHQIQFQYRPGTPELNCCSVNAPRGLGMLSEWAVMEDPAGLVVNFYGPSRIEFRRASGEKIELLQETNYPVDGTVRLMISPEKESEFNLRLRIPAWSKNTTVKINGEPVSDTPTHGTYLALKKSWKKGGVIELQFDMYPRYWVGQGPDRGGCAAVYAGPLLLAFDAYFNEIETAALKPLDMKKLNLTPVPVDRGRRPGHFPPMGLWKTSTVDGQEITLCDFGSAGAYGTDFAAWLPAVNVPPPIVALRTPEDGAKGAPSPILFRWEACSVPDTTFELLVARDADFKDLVVNQQGLTKSDAVIEEGFSAEGAYYWKVRTVNSCGTSDNRGGPRTFHVEAAADPFFALGENGLVLASALDGNATPSFGKLSLEEKLAPAPDRAGNANGALAFTNESKLRYKIPFFPEENYTFTAWVCPDALPTPAGIQQIFSAWCRGLDDPLRVTLDGDSLFARIEAKTAYTTQGVPLRNGEWAHVAAVKQGPRLTLYVNGQPGPNIAVPEKIYSAATEIGIGFNPLFQGGEHFTGRIDNFALYAAALTPEQIAELYKQAKPSKP